MVALTRLDLNNCKKIISYQEKALITGIIIQNQESPSDIILDEYGEKTKKNISRPNKKLNKLEIANIVEEYKSGINTNKLAKKYECHKATISRYLKKQGIEVTIKKSNSEQDIAEMAQMYESGLKASAIAKQFGISKTTTLNRLRSAGVKMRTRWGGN